MGVFGYTDKLGDKPLMSNITPVVSHYSVLQEDLRQWCSIGLQLQKEVKVLMDRFEGEDINVLECAVGKGEHAHMLRHYGFYVTTVDIDGENNPDVIHNLYSPLLPTFEREIFHAVTSHHTLEHLKFWNLPYSLFDFYQLLKPNGVLFVSLPVRCRALALTFRFARWFKTLVGRQLKDFTPSDWHEWEIDRKHPPSRIKKIMHTVGFKRVEIFQSPFNPFEYQFIAYKGD